ncbi:acyl-CoA N-acyltransferase [Penicillium sp. IBT 16267x]|nr:acyl-CoA N-acyltransferase [Penicillium sp. IBT 16267x]
MAAKQSVTKGFVSKRLLYRAVEDSDEDKAFFQKELEIDPTTQALMSGALQRPASKKNIESIIKNMEDSMLAVIICLLPEMSEENSSPKNDAHTPDQAPTEAKPVPIGLLVISHFGSGFNRHRRASLCISLKDESRGKGYGPEPFNWALDWAFQCAGLHKVCLGCFTFNHHALGLYPRLGFVEEGRERESIFYRRAWYDLVLFSMLEHEWEKLRAAS